MLEKKRSTKHPVIYGSTDDIVEEKVYRARPRRQGVMVLDKPNVRGKPRQGKGVGIRHRYHRRGIFDVSRKVVFFYLLTHDYSELQKIIPVYNLSHGEEELAQVQELVRQFSGDSKAYGGANLTKEDALRAFKDACDEALA